MTTTTDKPTYSDTHPTEPGWYWLKWPWGTTIGTLYGDRWLIDGKFFPLEHVRSARAVLFGPKIEPPREEDT